jgi:hypothetical protein
MLLIFPMAAANIVGTDIFHAAGLLWSRASVTSSPETSTCLAIGGATRLDSRRAGRQQPGLRLPERGPPGRVRDRADDERASSSWSPVQQLGHPGRLGLGFAALCWLGFRELAALAGQAVPRAGARDGQVASALQWPPTSEMNHLRELISDIPGWLTDEEGEALLRAGQALHRQGRHRRDRLLEGEVDDLPRLGSRAGQNVPSFAVDPHADYRFGEFKETSSAPASPTS